jgi:hypothetical protein
MEAADAEKWANYEGTEELAGVEFLNYNADGLDGARAPCEIDLAELFKKESDDVSFTGTCDNCYLYAGVTLNFGIKLKDWEVQELTTYVEGGIAANLAISSLNMEGAFAKSKKIATYISKEVSIPISGGPGSVFIKAEIPVTLALEGEMEGEMEVEGGAGGKLAMKSGVRFTLNGGELKREMFQDIQTEARAQGFSPKKISGEAALRLKLIPVINIQTQLGIKVGSSIFRLAKLGGPSVTLEFMAETLFSGNYDIDAGTGSAEVVPQIAVNGAIGSNMKFQLSLGSKKSSDLLGGKGKTDPLAIFSQKYPLAQFTASVGGRRLNSHGTWKVAGTTWTGSQSTHPSKSVPCSGPENLYLTMQLVEVEMYFPGPTPPGQEWKIPDATFYYNVVTSQGSDSLDGGKELFAEIKQEKYKIGFRSYGIDILPCPAEITPNDGGGIIPEGHQAFIFEVVADPDIDYEETTRGAGSFSKKVGFLCRDEDGLTRFIMEDTGLCVMVDMKQEVPSSRRLDDEPEEIELECKDIENGGVIGFANEDDLKRLDTGTSAMTSGSATRPMISTGWLMALMLPNIFEL